MSAPRPRALSRALFATTIVFAALLTAPLTATAAPETQTATASPAAASVSVAQATQYVYNATNQVRFDAKLDGLARDSRLDKVAADWAYKQWKNGKMSHNPNYSSQIPSGWQRAGENVASGYSYTQVVPAWVNSSSHYANLVRDYTSIGIGYYEADGKRYWSQVFGKYPGTKVPARPTSEPTPPPAPKPTPEPAPSYPAEPSPPAGARVTLGAPSFEGGSSGWSLGGARVEGPVTTARGGKYDVAGSGARTIGQTVSMAPSVGATYTATIWVKPGSTGKVSGSLRLSAVGGNAEVATMSFSVSSGWMKVSVPLTIARNGHSGLRIEAIMSSGEFRLDSASLVRTGNAPAKPAPAPEPEPSSEPTPEPSPSNDGGLLGGLLGTKSKNSNTGAPPAPAPAPKPAPKPATNPAPAPAPAPEPEPSSSGGGLLGGLLGL